jgi:aconitate hydratase
MKCVITKPDGAEIEFEAKHTFSPEQVEWFKAGSALNIVRQKVAGSSSPKPARGGLLARLFGRR